MIIEMKVVRPYIFIYGIRRFYFYLTGVNWEDKMSVEAVAVTYNSLLERHLQKISEMEKNELTMGNTEAVKPNEKVESEIKNVNESERVNDLKGGSEEIEKKQNRKRELLYPIIIATAGEVLSVFIIAIVAGVTGIYSDIKSIPNMATKEDIADMVTTTDIADMVTTADIADMATTNNINGMSKAIDELEGKIDDIDKEYDDKYEELIRSVGVLEGRLGIYVDPTMDVISKINETYSSYDNTYNESNNYVWMDLKQEVGRDFITGAPYTAEDLENEIVILSYIDENNDEVFFKGTFNENNQWEGNCIINKYSNGNLKYIMNANYESGKLITYNQVFSYVNSLNKEVWAISSRTVEEKGNAGQTWTYFKEREYKKYFENEYLTAENIINEEYFYNIMDLKIEGYYNGYTSNGYFNDESENAYMVRYNEDGYIRLFYTGRFVNGQAYDKTGSASVIAFGYDEENYYHYSGVIEDISKIGNGWEKISVDEVKKKIMNSNYSGPLVLYGDVV